MQYIYMQYIYIYVGQSTQKCSTFMVAYLSDK